MKNNIDVNELTKMIEDKINLINSKTLLNEEEYENTIFDLSKLTQDIEKRIKELEIEYQEDCYDFTMDLNDLTKKVNKKLEDMDLEDELEKTIYDLREITEVISKTINKMEKNKEKKLKKKKYCDLARKGIIVNKKNTKKCTKKTK